MSTTSTATRPAKTAAKREAPKPANKPIVSMEQQKDASRIDKAIRQVQASYSKSRMLVQTVALDIMRHAAPVANGGKGFGDCTKAYKLAMAVPARERNSLVGFFELFSPIGIDFNKQNARFRNEESKDIVKRGYVWNIDGVEPIIDNNKMPLVAGATAQYWFDDPAGRNPEPKAYSSIGDFWGLIQNLLDKAIKDADKQSLKDDRGMIYKPDNRERVKKAAVALKGVVLEFKKAETDAAMKGQDVIPRLEVKAVEPGEHTQTDEEQQRERAAA